MIIKCDHCNIEFNCSPSNLDRYRNHYCCISCKHIAEQQFCPNILEFQRKLFEKPITELALEYDISVKTIHKFINQNKLIRPARGSWQKIFANKLTIEELKKEKHIT